MLTGFHGGHVALGVAWLLTLWSSTCAGGSAPADAVKVEVAGLYWHFVDVVWIVIFTARLPDPVSAHARAAAARAERHGPREHASVRTYVKVALDPHRWSRRSRSA